MKSMAKNPLSEDDFLKKYRPHEQESLEDFIKRYSVTETELRETIAYLINHRQLLRDAELEVLQVEAESLVKRLKDTKLKMLVEEIECFKEILDLHKRLLEKNDNPGY